MAAIDSELRANQRGDHRIFSIAESANSALRRCGYWRWVRSVTSELQRLRSIAADWSR
jgi:hypothetical protein